MNTKSPPIDTLEQRADRAATEMAEVRAEQERAAQAEHDRLTEHRANHDNDIINGYQAVKATAETAVQATRAALMAALEADPVTVALADWYATQAHRREVFDRFIAARGRQGLNVGGAQAPRSDEGHLPELRDQVARRAAQERTDAERAALDAAYDHPKES